MSDDHDQGLANDIATLRLLDRRRAIGLLGAASGWAYLAGCGPGGSSARAGGVGTSTPTLTSACTSYAAETDGPFPADGTNTSRGATSNVLSVRAFQRSDIRSTVRTGTVAIGAPLDLTLTFLDANDGCAPLVGYAIYLWHNDAAGRYSLYDLPDEDYLRGIQVTDARGQVHFRTIFPGCYGGRYPHLHFEAFASLASATTGEFARLTSQFAMPSAESAALYASSGNIYGASLSNFRQISLTSDGIFGDNTAAQREAMTLGLTGSAAAGYAGSATIGIGA